MIVAAEQQHTATSPLPIAEAVIGWISGQGGIGEQTAHWGAAEWEAARWAAQVHGIAPLLAVRLRDHPSWPNLAPAFAIYLSEQYRLNGLRSALLLEELATICAVAERAGVSLIPLKGATLAGRLYRDPALRPLADLDLLVQPADEAQIGALLLALGYRKKASTLRHRMYEHCAAQKVVSTIGEHPDNPRGVELHTALGESFWSIRYEMTAVAWQSAMPVQGWGGLQLAPEHLLEHLLIHCAADMIACKARFIRLYDLALVAPTLDGAGWQRIVAHAEEQDQQRLLYAPLVLAERYLGQLAPGWVVERLAQGTPAALRRYLLQLRVSEVALTNAVPAPLSKKLSWFRPGREQLGALRAMLCPTPQELRQRDPRITSGFALARSYLAHGRRMLAWPLRLALGLPRRAWVQREQGGEG